MQSVNSRTKFCSVSTLKLDQRSFCRSDTHPFWIYTEQNNDKILFPTFSFYIHLLVSQIVYFTATTPLVLLIILFFRGVHLNGYQEGLALLFIPQVLRTLSFLSNCNKCVNILQLTCYQQLDIRMCSHGLRELVEDRAVASCQDTCCKLIVNFLLSTGLLQKIQHELLLWIYYISKFLNASKFTNIVNSRGVGGRGRQVGFTYFYILIIIFKFYFN